MHIRPADLTITVHSRSNSILKKIITGRDRHNLLSDAMPEWKDSFSNAQLDAMIAYLRFPGRSRHELTGDPRPACSTTGSIATY